MQTLILQTQLAPGDIGEITRLHGVIYAQERAHGIAFEAYVAAGLAEFQQRFDPALDRLWLYRDGERLAGTLFLAHREEGAQLRYFLVTPDYRGRGLGKALMAHFMRALDEIGYAQAFLWTTDGLDASAALYRQHGFVGCETQRSTRFGPALIERKYAWRR
jgi:GNAT superfamily N-acetyltransferase